MVHPMTFSYALSRLLVLFDHKGKKLWQEPCKFPQQNGKESCNDFKIASNSFMFSFEKPRASRLAILTENFIMTSYSHLTSWSLSTTTAANPVWFPSWAISLRVTAHRSLLARIRSLNPLDTSLGPRGSLQRHGPGRFSWFPGHGVLGTAM